MPGPVAGKTRPALMILFDKPRPSKLLTIQTPSSVPDVLRPRRRKATELRDAHGLLGRNLRRIGEHLEADGRFDSLCEDDEVGEQSIVE